MLKCQFIYKYYLDAILDDMVNNCWITWSDQCQSSAMVSSKKERAAHLQAWRDHSQSFHRIDANLGALAPVHFERNYLE